MDPFIKEETDNENIEENENVEYNHDEKIENDGTIKEINKLDNLICKKRKKGIIREYLGTIIFLILISILIRIFIIEAYTIPSESMVPTFVPDDRLMALKFLYGIRIPVLNISFPGATHPKHGDIIIFEHPNYESPGLEWEFLNLLTLGILRIDNNEVNVRILVKRCIALPGDTIYVDEDKNVFINDKKLDKVQIENTSSKFSNNVKNYKETNGEKTYIIREIPLSHHYNSNEIIYIPKKGDTLIIKKNTLSEEETANFDDYVIEIEETANFDDYVIEINDHKIENEIFQSRYKAIYIQEMNIDLNNLSNDYEYTIKHDYYFGMGDNRDNSRDSRAWGLIKDDLVYGSPLFIFYPFNRLGFIK